MTTSATPERVATVIHGVDDDMASLWADAFDELMGPLGTPRRLVTGGTTAWRVPKPAVTNKREAERFAHASASGSPAPAWSAPAPRKPLSWCYGPHASARTRVVRTLRWANRT